MRLESGIAGNWPTAGNGCKLSPFTAGLTKCRRKSETVGYKRLLFCVWVLIIGRITTVTAALSSLSSVHQTMQEKGQSHVTYNLIILPSVMSPNVITFFKSLVRKTNTSCSQSHCSANVPVIIRLNSIYVKNSTSCHDAALTNFNPDLMPSNNRLNNLIIIACFTWTVCYTVYKVHSILQ